MSGAFEAFGTLELTEAATGVNDQSDIRQPERFQLSQNFPNPFNPETNIAFSLPETGLVKLKVFDILGNEVAVLLNGSIPSGNHQISFHAENLPSGIYFYRLEAGSIKSVKKMILTD